MPEELRRKRARARRRAADTVQRLAELVDDAYRDGILEDREPDFAEGKDFKRTAAWMAGFTEAVRCEMARQGVSADELDVGLGWPEGRAERLLAQPRKLSVVEAELLCEELKTSMYEMFVASGTKSSTEEPLTREDR